MVADTQTVGIIGIGAMGSSLAVNLLDAGFDVLAFDIRAAALDQAAARGARPAGSPGAVAEAAAVTITCLPHAESFDAVVRGADGLLARARDGAIILECSVLPLQVKREAHDALADRGVVMLDTPVSGTAAQARDKDLLVLVSGDEAVAQRCEPIFAGMARAWPYLGAFGAGTQMKLLANHLVAVHCAAAAEAIALGVKAGLDPHQIVRVLSDSAGSSRMLQLRGPMMAQGSFASVVTARLEILNKDLKIIRDFAHKHECPTPLLSTATDLYTAAQAADLGDMDVAAVYVVLSRMAGLNTSPSDA